MSKYKLGLQMHAVREDFAENPAQTLKKVAAMGYNGVEFHYPALNRTPEEYNQMLADAGIECYGTLVSWPDLQPDKLAETMEKHRKIGTNKIIIGSVQPTVLDSEPDMPKKVVAYMNELYEILTREGFMTGYHNHDHDFTYTYNGQTFFEYVMDNTPKGFLMVLDTGNAYAGGGDPLALLKKYPDRTPILHIKGYSKASGYTTPVWESDLDWDSIIAQATEHGAEFLDIEFGARSDYIPLERAEKSATWLAAKIEEVAK